jgi:4-methylaminobutanoate oxidase (formaldehyde-forming)
VGLGRVEDEAGVTKEYIQDGTFEIQVIGERYPAKASLRPLLDPKNERVRN